MQADNGDVVRFGSFELWRERRRLLKDGTTVPAGARAFDVLSALVERRARIVSKSELLDAAWPGVVVEENNLPAQIGHLRKLLGAGTIATIPGRGYRFTAAVAEGEHDDDDASRASRPAAPDRAGGHALSNLPAEPPVLFGRDGALAALAALVTANRLVSVVGAGGIGKSSLAQAVAHSLIGRWDDGEWVVDLAGLADSRRVPHAVAQTLALSLQGEAPVDELVAAIAQRAMLLLVDKCEHLLDAVAELARAISSGRPT